MLEKLSLYNNHNIEDETLNYYNNMAREFVANTVDVTFTEIQDTFLSYLHNGAQIMDFGCGSGRDTKYFLDKGYDVDAVDGSEELCRLATEYTGIHVKQMFFEELDANEEYDGVWACASILHVQKTKLPDIIKRISRAVKKDGIVYLSFKYGDFEGMKNGRYFTYLTEEMLHQLLDEGEEKGYKFVIEKMWISGDVRENRGGERWLNAILRKREAYS